MRQASQSMQEESTKKSPGTFAGSLRAACATGVSTSRAAGVIPSVARDLGGGWRAGPPPRSLATLGMTLAWVCVTSPRMFYNLQDKMDRVFKTLRGEAALNEWHIDNALKEIRVALLEADVNFKVVREFTVRVREKAVGQEVLTAFSPAQQVTKIVRDELQGLLGGNEVGLALVGSPAVIMMVGLQGSGKTTTSGKLAMHLK